MAIYQCPMHPEIQRDRAETCPKCGMKLVEMKDTKPTDAPKRRSLLWRWQ